MKQLIFIFATLIMSQLATAQYRMFVLNYEKAYFNENEALPAGKYFIVNAPVKANTVFLETAIYAGGSNHASSKPVFETNWKRAFNENSPTFTMPINYELRENASYDIEFRFYKAVGNAEKAALYADVCKSLDSYIDLSATQDGSAIRFTKSKQKIVADMNTVVGAGTTLYRNRISNKFSGFSDMVAAKIEQLEAQKLQGAAPLFASRSRREAMAQARRATMETAVNALKEIVHSEVNNYLNGEIFVLEDRFNVDKYPTERVKGTVGINFGYAATFPTVVNDSKAQNYAAAPYAAISFPFGKETSPAFWRNTSLSLGAIFAPNFSDIDGNTYSGALVQVPTFAALGFRPYKFIKVNLGSAFLEKSSTDGQGNVNKQFVASPMISLGIEFNVSVELAK